MNKSYTRSLVAVFIAVVALMPLASQARAEQCISLYGGGEKCVSDKDAKLRVNKEVWDPVEKDWVDHIKADHYKFSSKAEIKFRITVKNIGDVEIKDIKLKDTLPDYVRYLKGDGDSEDSDSKVVFDEFDLKPGKSKSFEFTAKIASNNILPNGDRLCTTNKAKAIGYKEGKKDKDNEESDTDTANFCIKLGKQKITKLPATGFDFGLVGLSTGLVLVGFGLRKLTKE